ncbi:MULTISPECIES: DUF4870 domain-containing protein [unclassified Rathayibacter]|uniref:DUF4870 domain-containing protein n=1 Tax=unclassified Rathayibacter TaxID=2609250 RepID=UPI000CE731B4|nr:MULTISPECIES: DUF4870 domain-containing protein [unclassified Rathayibacter]PPF68718.1 hypothetical protein C5C46_14170 [Rathayibacter sp. AY1E6]PPG82099.1 hypothetical protein C5C29_14690 [Rathayibacter sp. AY1H2]
MASPSSDSRPADATTPEAAPVAPPQAVPAPPTGALSYALGFLAFIGIPFLSLIVGGIVMASVYPSARRKGGLAAENARNAANWGLTVILIGVVTLGAHVVLLFAASDTPLAKDFYPIGIPITLFAVLWLVHFVLIICGLVKANQREVFRPRIAIPFLRPPAA